LLKIFASKGLFNPKNINQILGEGAGFLTYSGHGTPVGIFTYSNLAFSSNILFLKIYTSINIKNVNNGDKLPIMFFDACSTARLDYTKQEFRNDNIVLYLYYSLFDSSELPGNLISCFAWNMIKHENGGAIATIGSTRIAYSTSTSGAGELLIDFFKAYNNDITLGEMLMNAQISFIDENPYDLLTISEFILLGDPSLKIGGY